MPENEPGHDKKEITQYYFNIFSLKNLKCTPEFILRNKMAEVNWAAVFWATFNDYKWKQNVKIDSCIIP